MAEFLDDNVGLI